MDTSLRLFLLFRSITLVPVVGDARATEDATGAGGKLGKLQSDSMRGTMGYTCGPAVASGPELLPPKRCMCVSMYNTYLLDTR
jgi:hypothetical protein